MSASLNDYKDWIQERADEIADEDWGDDFYDLTEHRQRDVYAQAMIEYIDAYSDWYDSIYERIREERMK